jgi:imidazolonepropionase-like amidohydrolase
MSLQALPLRLACLSLSKAFPSLLPLRRRGLRQAQASRKEDRDGPLKLITFLLALLCLGAAPDGGMLIRGARVFDGTGAPARIADVAIRGDRIVAVAPRLRPARGARLVDARGLTLIPGLHDLHTHLRATGFGGTEDLPKSYASHLTYGITSVVDFSMSGEMLPPVREMTRSGGIPAPNLQLAVRLGVPGGHGTEYGWGDAFTLEAPTPRAADLAMSRALAYRPDVIKVFADGWRYGRTADLNSMDVRTLAAIVRRAHAAGVPVITHTVTLEGAKVAARAGVDALGHGIGDAAVDDELIGLMRAGGTAYVPTMVVYEPQEDRAFAPAEWRRLRPAERAREEARIRAPLQAIPELEVRRWAILQDNLRRLKAAGVRIGIGTDAGIGGVYQGSSAIREIRLMTGLGLTPPEALAAATSNAAAILRRADHGRIAPGQRADLVLTGGRPDQRIEDLYDVRRVFVSGREVALAPLRQALASDADWLPPLRRMAGPIDTGAGRDGRTDLGTLPMETHEAGVDHSQLRFVRDPATRALRAVAKFGAAPQPFANLVLPLTPGMIDRADATGFSGIAFEARGTGPYTLLLDSYGVEPREAFRAPFEAGAARREVRIPFTALRSPEADAQLDLSRLRALLFRLEGEPGGTAALEVGNIHLYR